MGRPSETVSSRVVKALQSLPVWKQCFQTQFGMDFWQWKCFPQKCVYVRTVDSRITVFTMHVFCIFAMLFHLYFVVLRELVGAVT